MNPLKTMKKAGLGLLTFAVAYISANPQILTRFLPSDISQLTIGGAVAAGLVALSNWLKNRAK
jgi:hypothetical protein